MPVQRAAVPQGCSVDYVPWQDTERGGSMAKSPQPGDHAPDFELEGTDGKFRLADHRGSRVVLLFYPGDNTPVCTRQFCSYRDKADDVTDLDAVIVGISAQDLDSHAAFVAKHGLNVPLLADVHGEVAKLYGAHAAVVGTRRAVIVIDEQGVVRARHDHRIGIDYQDVDDLRAMLGNVPART
jgi:peroxiredoxin Q/BCP